MPSGTQLSGYVGDRAPAVVGAQDDGAMVGGQGAQRLGDQPCVQRGVHLIREANSGVSAVAISLRKRELRYVVATRLWATVNNQARADPSV